jgi:hypothetical protein
LIGPCLSIAALKIGCLLTFTTTRLRTSSFGTHSELYIATIIGGVAWADRIATLSATFTATYGVQRAVVMTELGSFLYGRQSAR